MGDTHEHETPDRREADQGFVEIDSDAWESIRSALKHRARVAEEKAARKVANKHRRYARRRRREEEDE